MRKKLPSFWEPVALLLVSLTFMVLILRSESMINFIETERMVGVADIALAFLFCIVTCFFVLNLCKIILYYRLIVRRREKLYKRIVGLLFDSIAIVVIISVSLFLFGIVVLTLEKNDGTITKYITITSVVLIVLIYSAVNFNRKIDTT